MKELSLNILDIAENSLKAEATLTEILLFEDEEKLTVTIKDNGYGMSDETIKSVINPFYTTRKTRSVGLGIPLFKLAAEQTGGNISITSKQRGKYEDCGTTVTAVFFKKHLDFTPLGDIVSTITTLIQGHPDRDFLFLHKFCDSAVRLDTREIREILEDIPIDSFEILCWIKNNLLEQYGNLKNLT